MKNFLIKLLTLCLATCCVLTLFSACGGDDGGDNNETPPPAHTCEFAKQVVEEKYKKTDATCEDKAVYYYSCECKEKGEETFEHGEELGHQFTDYVPDNNATYDNDGTKTATCDRDGCDETDTVADIGTKLESRITFKTLSLEEKNVFSNSIEEFSFVNEIEVFGNSKFIIARDKYGEQIIFTKIAPLAVGDNTFYVFESIDDEIVNTYVVTLRRRPTYSVTFDSNGGSAITSQTIEEGFSVIKPQDPTRDGYSFNGWDFDFTMQINTDIIINAKWTANTDTPYKVEYYFENLEDNGYTIDQSKTENKTGTTDTTVSAQVKTFEHFTLNNSKSSLSDNLNGNGKTVLKVYYTRNKYNISINDSVNASITNGGTYKYGKQITSTIAVNLGYDFIGWFDGESNLSTEKTYMFTVDCNVTAKIEMKEEMKIFDFTSTPNLCTITGLKDRTATNIVIPNSVTSIGERAFNSCDSLETIEIPNSVTSIGERAFNNCDSLETIEIPNSVTSIGNFAFYSCNPLVSVNFGNNSKLISIGDYAFGWCNSLETIKIPSGVTSIGERAFYNCLTLEEIEIPSSVTSIGTIAFEDCSLLTSIIVDENNEHYKSIDGNLYSKDGKTLVQYAIGKTATTFTIADGVTSIGEWAFTDCSSLETIEIPNSVTSIGNSVFYSCDSLTIYCEVESKPSGWADGWNLGSPVVWGSNG